MKTDQIRRLSVEQRVQLIEDICTTMDGEDAGIALSQGPISLISSGNLI